MLWNWFFAWEKKRKKKKKHKRSLPKAKNRYQCLPNMICFPDHFPGYFLTLPYLWNCFSELLTFSLPAKASCIVWASSLIVLITFPVVYCPLTTYLSNLWHPCVHLLRFESLSPPQFSVHLQPAVSFQVPSNSCMCDMLITWLWVFCSLNFSYVGRGKRKKEFRSWAAFISPELHFCRVVLLLWLKSYEFVEHLEQLHSNIPKLFAKLNYGCS